MNVYFDLGSGDGTLTSFVTNILKPRQVICVDTDDEALKRYHGKGFETLKVELNVTRILLRDNSIDVCTAFELVEHLWNKDNLLEKVYRILKVEGMFMLSTPNLATWAGRILLLLGKPPLHYDVSLKYALHRPSYKHISLYTPDLVVKHLEVCRLRSFDAVVQEE